ncbi:MAG: ABC transporter ATP-binding protein [Lachnospiraceae bacterium]|nr:ABC transporter ATP-binding protein [Lachnospiraceae bacterium]
MSEELLRLTDLHVSFRSGGGWKKKEEKHVLKGVSFSVAPGEIVGLAGESGSGKSTIAKAILGMVPYQSGSIEKNCASPQMIFQDPYSSLNSAYSISWILQEPLRLAGGYTREQLKEKAAAMMREVGLDEELLIRKPRELSGGQRQRVCIGMALMRSPELLIADEPVSALDVTVAAQVLALLKKLHEEKGLAMLFISHDLRTMYHFCDRILILHDGRIVEEGIPSQLYRDPKEDYTRLLLKSAGIS